MRSPLSWRQKLPFYETAYRLVHHNRNSVGVCELARICGMGRDEVVGLIDTAAPGYFLRRGGSVFLVHPERRAST